MSCIRHLFAKATEWDEMLSKFAKDTKFNSFLRKIGVPEGVITGLHSTKLILKKPLKRGLGIASAVGGWEAFHAITHNAPKSVFFIGGQIASKLGAIGGGIAIALSGGGILATAALGAAIWGGLGVVIGGVMGAIGGAAAGHPGAGAAVGAVTGGAVGAAGGALKGAILGGLAGVFGGGPISGAIAGGLLSAAGI